MHFAAPLTILTQLAQELSVGNIVRDESGWKERLHRRKDEIGAINRAFERLIKYFQGGVEASSAIADKDLTITVTPNSERDELGIAFAKMLNGLQHVIHQVAENAQAVSCAATELATASDQSGQAANQIALTIQQVATGITQQSQEVARTSRSVKQINRSINAVAKGAQRQAQAVNKTSSMAAQISSAMQQATANAQSGAREARQAADATCSGARKIEATTAGMQTIKTVESKGEKTMETLLQQHMLGVASLVTYMLVSGHDLQSKDLATLVRQRQKAVIEAVGVMEAGVRDVESRSIQAMEAGESLATVIKTVEAVNRQVGEITEAIEHREASSRELVRGMEAVSTIVEENIATIEEMAANSSEMTQAVENIASVSEENSAAVEEVSASTEEVSAQVEQVTASAVSLMEMAQNLQQIVAQFILSLSAQDIPLVPEQIPAAA